MTTDNHPKPPDQQRPLCRIQQVPLDTVSLQDLVSLMQTPQLRDHMPLLRAGFSEADARAFLQAKAKLWQEHGFGPSAFLIDGQFAGWGGLQPEAGEADFALVLHPRFWGWGFAIWNLVRTQAFRDTDLQSIIALLPPSRTRAGVIKRLGFVPDGSLSVGGETFLRFRHSRDPS